MYISYSYVAHSDAVNPAGHAVSNSSGAVTTLMPSYVDPHVYVHHVALMSGHQ